MKSQKFVVKTNFIGNGRLYKAGETAELTESLSAVYAPFLTPVEISGNDDEDSDADATALAKANVTKAAGKQTTKPKA